MEVIIFTPKDMETFKAKTKSVYDKWIKEIGADLVKSAEKMVKGSNKLRFKIYHRLKFRIFPESTRRDSRGQEGKDDRNHSQILLIWEFYHG